jgi:hypothetical protein
MQSEMKVPAAPERRRGRRPILSIKKRAGRVERVWGLVRYA